MIRILFVCVENACRSQLAQALMRMHGQDQVQVYSAGSKPSGVVNPKAIQSMHELGYDLSVHDSKSLDEIPNIEYDYAITMGCGDECPLVRAKHRADWGIPDPKHLPMEEFREIRNLIESKVLGLLKNI